MSLSNQKGFIPIIVIVGIFLLILGGGGGYFYFYKINSLKNVSQPELSSPSLSDSLQNKSNQIDETSNWVTYTDPKWRFIFKYPSGWQASVEAQGDYYRVNLQSKDNQGIYKGGESGAPSYVLYVNVYKKDSYNLEEEAKIRGSDYPQCFEGGSCDPLAPKEILKKSNPDLKDYFLVVSANGLKHTVIPIPKEPNHYIDIETWYFWPKDDNGLYDQLISTFKFINSSPTKEGYKEEVVNVINNLTLRVTIPTNYSISQEDEGSYTAYILDEKMRR